MFITAWRCANFFTRTVSPNPPSNVGVEGAIPISQTGRLRAREAHTHGGRVHVKLGLEPRQVDSGASTHTVPPPPATRGEGKVWRPAAHVGKLALLRGWDRRGRG